eukprot:gene20582-21254_t
MWPIALAIGRTLAQDLAVGFPSNALAGEGGRLRKQSDGWGSLVPSRGWVIRRSGPPRAADVCGEPCTRADVMTNLFTRIADRITDPARGAGESRAMNKLVNIFERALAALNGGRLAEAEVQFRTFLKNQPNHVGALNLLTVALMAMGRFSDAEPLIRKAVGLDKTSAKSFLNYSIILKNLNRPAEALEKLTIAQRINPRDPEIWTTRGALHAGLGHIDDAINDFNAAIALLPAHP